MHKNINYGMFLNFLPTQLATAIQRLAYDKLSEIRIREGQAVIIEYDGEYKYIDKNGVTDKKDGAILVTDVEKILFKAMGESVFAFSEQLKNGFITIDGGIRIGVAGEYVAENGYIKTIKNPTSLNIRLPHDVDGCAYHIYQSIFKSGIFSTLIYSPPGFGKTTMLRDLIRILAKHKKINILVLDERREISAFKLSGGVDVILCSEKLSAIENAIRAMKPQVIVTDELYGERDFKAVKYAVECGIKVIASSHIVERNILKNTPFEYFVELTGIGKQPKIYDKNFISVSDNNFVRSSGVFIID